MPTTRDAIHRLLAQAPAPLGPTEIAERVGAKTGYVRQVLGEMVADGEAVKPRRGRYALAPSASRPAPPPGGGAADDEFVPISALDEPREPVRGEPERNGSAAPAAGGHPDGAERAWFYVTLPNGARRYYDAAFNLVAWEGEPAFLGAVSLPAPPEPAR